MDNATATFTAIQTRGLAGVNAPANHDSTTIVLDGARTDLVRDSAGAWRADTTRVRVNAYGAPVNIRNAAGESTLIHYDSISMPLLATRVYSPDGQFTRAEYDSQARLLLTEEPNHPSGLAAMTEFRYTDPDRPDRPSMILQRRDTIAYDTTRF